ncbi:hypothetical protein DH2020_040328 [Rehmannia glutinosa]|uniref:BHLH domain-containing protein n=1 Tax=Rehmannia glutinosa TaxID=99300 RepID=A0ABR0UUJ3_REHGL
MFPSPNSDIELLLQEPSILQHDLTVDLPVNTSTKKRQRGSKWGFQENNSKDNEETNERKLRKTMHKEIEKQRRQEMAGLYASLRSLLPPEYIKGKRSISDQIQEAMNYIKHMERNNKELRMQRDKLKKMSSKSAGSEKGSSNSVNLANCVTVSSCRYGVEVSVSCGINEVEDGFSLSRVLMELLETGLHIVNDLTYINLPELQQRLANVINFG